MQWQRVCRVDLLHQFEHLGWQRGTPMPSHVSEAANLPVGRTLHASSMIVAEAVTSYSNLMAAAPSGRAASAAWTVSRCVTSLTNTLTCPATMATGARAAMPLARLGVSEWECRPGAKMATDAQ